MTQGQIYGNLTAIRCRIAEAARRVGRNPEEIRLVAVSKTIPVEIVWEAFLAGQIDFGESRVQELKAKDELIRGKAETLPENKPFRWHMIGYLQTNKVRTVVERCAMIHSVDRLALGEAVSREAVKQNRAVPVLIEVNVGGEISKAGVAPEKAAELVSGLAELEGIKVVGLMTVPPSVREPGEVRPYFRKLRKLGEELSTLHIPGVVIRELSMGMSHDFEVAVEEGATMVRVGTALFGPRNRG